MDKGLILGFIANRVLPKSEYKRLTSKFTKGHQNGIAVYDTAKMYKVLSKVEQLKPYVDDFDKLDYLIEHGRLNEARSIIEGKQQAIVGEQHNA